METATQEQAPAEEREGTSPDAYMKRMTETGEETFSQHRISKTLRDHEETWARWLIQKRYDDDKGWDWTCAAEIITLSNGGILVSGDWSPVVFAHGPADPHSRIAWMGSHPNVDSYIAEKATIGMGGRGDSLTEQWDSDVALWRLDDVISDRKEWLTVHTNDDPDFDADPVIEALKDARDHRYDGAMPLYHFLQDALGGEGYEWFFDEAPNIGNVISPRVIYAHAAIRRLHLILTEANKGADDGDKS